MQRKKRQDSSLRAWNESNPCNAAKKEKSEEMNVKYTQNMGQIIVLSAELTKGI